MKHTLILLSLLVLSSCTDTQAISYESSGDGKPRNS